MLQDYFKIKKIRILFNFKEYKTFTKKTAKLGWVPEARSPPPAHNMPITVLALYFAIDLPCK